MNEFFQTITQYAASIEAIGSVAVLVVGTGGLIVAYRTYLNNKRKERIIKNVDMRNEFLRNACLSKIQSSIEHKDPDLRKVLEVLNAAQKRDKQYEPGLFNDLSKREGKPAEDYEKLHQDLDNYLNQLETVGYLKRLQWLKSEDFRGFWEYYFKRLRQWSPLWEYVSFPKYEWKDVTDFA